MAKLYRARLFRLMLEDEDSNDYEVYRIGTVIVIHFYNETNVKDEYIVLREDLSEKNLMTKKDMIKFDYDSYASMAMKLKQYEEAPIKKLFKTKNGVVYGKSIGRG